MKKLAVLLFSTLAGVLMLGLASGNAFAQAPVGDASVYFVTYFSNNVPAAPNAVVRMINDADKSTLWANYYVFDDSQELQECCSCFLARRNVNSEGVRTNLTANTITSKPVTRGVIKILSSSTKYADTRTVIQAGLHGTATHIQPGQAAGSYVITEAPVADANLTEPEALTLENLCYYAGVLGSGRGVCSCTPEDHDF